MKREKTTAILLILLMAILVVPMAMAKKPFPDVTSTEATYNIFWELTDHPNPNKQSGEWTVTDEVAWSHTDTELFTKVTGAAIHSWDTFEDYDSYTFVDKHVLVYDQDLRFYTYTIKGSTMEYVWMTDWTLLHPDDVDAYVAENPDESIMYHFKDYFIGVARFTPSQSGESVLRWMLYRQYSYWIQTEYTRDTFGFPEEIGDRIHATHTGSTYEPSDELWQGLSTYFVLPDMYKPSDIGVGGKFGWLASIYDAFPETFNGFNYKWLPE